MDILFNNENGPSVLFKFKNRGDGRSDDVASARGIADEYQNGGGYLEVCVAPHLAKLPSFAIGWLVVFVLDTRIHGTFAEASACVDEPEVRSLLYKFA